MKKRLLAILLTVCLVVILAPSVLAADSTIHKVATKAELQNAIASATDGNIIQLTADIDYGTDQLKIEKAITLDLGGKTLTTRMAYGGMSVKGNPTIKNGTIVHASNTAAIKVWNAAAFEDLVIDVQGKDDANKTIGGIVVQEGSTVCVGSIKNVTIKGDALTNGIETYNCGNATNNVIGSMENVAIEANGTAMLISAPVGTATNCTFKGGVSGIEIWIKGTYSASLALGNCQVTGGEQDVYAHDEFASGSVTNIGTITLTADESTTFTNKTLTKVLNQVAETQVTLPAGLKEKWDGINIKNADDLLAFAAAVNAGDNFAGKTVNVVADIDMSGIDFTPIGGYQASMVFKGTFDGGSHTISNLTITKTDDVSAKVRLGLFSNINGATIKNLTIDGAAITAKSSNARGTVLVMTAENGNTLSNITIKNSSVNVESGETGYAAGIVGYFGNEDSTVSSLDNFNVENLTLTVSAENTKAGAVSGYMCKGNQNKVGIGITNGTVKDLTIVSNASSASNVGGLIGESYKVDPQKVDNVDIAGLAINFSGSGSKVGGVIGWDQSVSYNNATKQGWYNDVHVTGTINENITSGSGSEVGGFVGVSHQYPHIYTNCSADVDIVTGNRAGGFVGTPCPNGWSNSTDLYSNCTASGDVTAPIAGGFVGCAWLNNGSNTTLKLENVTATGVVTGTTHAGGLIGGAFGSGGCSNIVIKDSTASQIVIGPDAGNTAGVVGNSNMASGKKITLDNVTWTVDPPINPTSAPAEITDYTVTFETQTGANIIVKNRYETEITPNDDGTYTLVNGEYSYTISLEGYTSKAGSFIVKGENLTLTIDLSEIVYYTVIYTDGVDDEVIFADQSFTVEAGTDTPTFAGTPERSGYTFIGWTPAVSATVTADVTYTAVWQENSTPTNPDNNFDYDAWYWALMMLYNQQFDVSASATDGGIISPAGISKVKYDKNITYTITPHEGYAIADVLVNGESVGAVSEYTIKRIKKDQTIHAIFVKTAWANPYTDVSDEAWYYEDIEFVSENGLMIGTGDNKFSPNETLTRAMVVTILWRVAGEPITESSVDFYDVPANEWYSNAIAWASSKGIVLGYGDGTFGINDPITREQLATILYRYEQYLGGGFTGMWMYQMEYTDLTDVADWAYEAVAWTAMKDIYVTRENNLLAPKENATRAETAAFIHRFCVNMANK